MYGTYRELIENNMLFLVNSLAYLNHAQLSWVSTAFRLAEEGGKGTNEEGK